AVAVRDEEREFEPGVEAVPVDFALDAGEDLFPDVAAGHIHVHATWPSRGLSPAGHRANASVPLRDRGIGPGKWTAPALRPAETRYTSGTPAWGPVKTRAFPHFFPQLWKASGAAPRQYAVPPTAAAPPHPTAGRVSACVRPGTPRPRPVLHPGGGAERRTQ